MKPRYTINITYVSWCCGDGCCSDSGLKLDCYDNQEKKYLKHENDWEYNRKWGWLLEETIEAMMDELQEFPEQYNHYEIKYWNQDYNTGDTDPGYESDFKWMKD